MDELTTLNVVVGVGSEGAVHSSVGNRNNEVAVLVGLSARPKPGGEVRSVTKELGAGSCGGGRRARDQTAAGLNGGGGNCGDRKDESQNGGGELHDSDSWK